MICIGAVTAIGTGLDVSGGGAVIADTVLNMFGGANASVVVLTVVICVLSSVLTLFLQEQYRCRSDVPDRYFHGAY